ncbi:uncharacterized protein [Eurosta solidaginis]|uniref:uncharacterized protein isoform X1 n=1 Tax=Eurosta solidaginis TaxID=178769 RepID=UPI0035313A91
MYNCGNGNTNLCKNLLFLLLFCIDSIVATISANELEEKQSEKVLSRKRRYVAFPEGSSLAATICLTIGMIGNPQKDYMSWAENWGVAYDLPDYAWAKEHVHGFKTDEDMNKIKAVVKRRSRRDLFGKIETIIDNMGFNGHACIARTLCESSKYLHDPRQGRGNMMTEIVKTIFSLPKEPVYADEPEILHHYDRIYKRSRREVLDCSVEHWQCHFSLLEMAFGQYSVARTKHGSHLLTKFDGTNGFM